VILDTELDYPAYHDKTLLDMCWDYDLKSYALKEDYDLVESYALKEDSKSALADLTKDSTLFDTKSPVKINDQDPTDEDFEKNNDFVCGSNCVCDLCNESQLIHDSKYRHEREETPEPSELSVERRKGMCECTLIQSFDDFNSAVCLFDNSYFAQCVFFCTQSVEKCLKSLCTLLNICFKQYICLHDGRSIMGILYNKIFHNNTTEGTTLFAKLVYLCDEFENIGSSFWEIKECLSIRCRYFFYYKARVYRCQFHQCSTSNFFTHPDPESVKKSVSLLCFQFQ
jgi:hypothetical protein